MDQTTPSDIHFHETNSNKVVVKTQKSNFNENIIVDPGIHQNPDKVVTIMQILYINSICDVSSCFLIFHTHIKILCVF